MMSMCQISSVKSKVRSLKYILVIVWCDYLKFVVLTCMWDASNSSIFSVHIETYMLSSLNYKQIIMFLIGRTNLTFVLMFKTSLLFMTILINDFYSVWYICRYLKVKQSQNVTENNNYCILHLGYQLFCFCCMCQFMQLCICFIALQLTLKCD